MREAGLVVERALQAVARSVAAGVTTADLDQIAHGVIEAAGAVPSFQGFHGFPATICACVNEEIVHGNPARARSLTDGDIVSVDCGAAVDGWHADAAVTLPVGEVSADVAALLDTCERALWHGVVQARAGHHVSDVSHAMEDYVRSRAEYGIIEDYVGHGIGSELHMEPIVPNLGYPGRGPVLGEGMAVAIEPLLALGSPATRLLEDGWTVVTQDGSWSAHFEHTVVITGAGPWVLTAADGGREGVGWVSMQPSIVRRWGGAGDGR